MDISIPRIWQRVGSRTWHREATADALVTPPGPGPYLLVLHWPVSASYLSVTAKRGAEAFVSDPDQVIQLLREHRIPEERQFPPRS